MISIPKFFHEILGDQQRKIELLLIVLFTAISTAYLFMSNTEFITSLPLLNQGVLMLFALDITGGVVANLTYGTDRFYSQRKKARLIFIMIHIQPLIIFWAAKLPLWIGLVLWGYTIFCALILELYKNHPSQKVFAGFDFCISLLIIYAFQNALNPFVSLIMILFCFKVLYSFSVTHHKGE